MKARAAGFEQGHHAASLPRRNCHTARFVAFSMVLALLLPVLATAGCSGPERSISSIYSLTTSAGTITRKGESATMVLEGVPKTATRFTMRPDRDSDPVGTAGFISGWDEAFNDGTATAALSLDASAGNEAAVMTMREPVYDQAKGTLTCQVAEAPEGVGRGAWEGRPLSEAPGRFPDATLYVQEGPVGAGSTPIFVSEGPVSISFRGIYYFVNIDMTLGVSRYRIGQQYAKAINRMNPDANFRISTYVTTLMSLVALEHDISGSELLRRSEVIKSNLEEDYYDEIAGLASGMKSYFPFSSSDLFYLFNLLPDVFRWSSCSALAAWGDSSSTGSNTVHRTLDWYEGLFDELAEIQAIVRYHYADRDVHMIGALGHLGCITGIATADPDGRNGILGGVMDADVTGSRYSVDGCCSYNFDLRYSLEHFNTKDEIARFMADRPYTFSNLILLADASDTVALENNVSGKGKDPSRAVRYDDSPLNPGIEWGYPSMIGAVNCFCLLGQADNFHKGINGEINIERWALLREKIDEYDTDGGYKFTPGDIRKIMNSFSGSVPGSLEADEGDLYNQQTQQMAFYQPAEGYLEVFFKALDGSTPKVPSYTSIPLERAH